MEMDHSALWAQIGYWTKVRLAVVPGTLLCADGALLFGIAGRGDKDPVEPEDEEQERERALRRRQVNIRLNGLGLYDITLCHFDRETFTWVQDGEAAGTDVTVLNETLLRLARLGG